MMKILPYDEFTIVTDDSLPIILERLNANVEPPKVFRFSKRHALYQGSIGSESFQISRIIHYRNSFLPTIRGRFEVQSPQTLVHIQMSLHPIVMAFIWFWPLFWYSAITPAIFMSTIPAYIGALFLGIPVFMLVIFCLAFWAEAHRSRAELTKIIQGKI